MFDLSRKIKGSLSSILNANFTEGGSIAGLRTAGPFRLPHFSIRPFCVLTDRYTRSSQLPYSFLLSSLSFGAWNEAVAAACLRVLFILFFHLSSLSFPSFCLCVYRSPFISYSFGLLVYFLSFNLFSPLYPILLCIYVPVPIALCVPCAKKIFVLARRLCIDFYPRKMSCLFIAIYALERKCKNNSRIINFMS